MPDCIFCQIICKKLPAEIVYQDDRVTAFRDIHPVAPTHILIVPNRHIASTNDLAAGDETLVGHMLMVVPHLALQEGIQGTGYRLIVNTGPHANQVIFHLHLHLIGGQRLRYPMG